MNRNRNGWTRRIGARCIVGGTLLLAAVLMTGCPDKRPPGPVKDFAAIAGDAQVALSWTNPNDGDYNHTTIVRKEASAPTALSDGVLIYIGAGTAVTDTGPVNGTEYFYSAWAFDDRGNQSDVAIAGGVIPTAASAAAGVLEELADLGDDVAGAPEIPGEQQAAMEEALDDADSKYRGGDACGAGISLQGFLGIAQEVRTGAAVEVAEELYNRGRMLRYEMLANDLQKADCPEADRIGQEADAEASEESTERVLALAEFGEPKVATVKENEETFTELALPGSDPRTGVPGEPAVPMISRLIAVPLGAELDFDMSYELAETIHLNLTPVQAEPVDQVDDPFANQPFVKNEDRYATDALYPSDENVAVVQFLGEMRDLRMYLLTVAGGQYNPVSDELHLFKNLSVDVSFIRGSGGFITENTSHAFDDLTKSSLPAVINRNSVLQGIRPGFQWEIPGEEMMIITTPTLREAADTLATWKTSKGILTHVFEAMDVDGPGPDSASGIDTMIENRYDTALVRPSYILLLGDSEVIPTFYPAAEDLDTYGNPGAGTWTIGSDWQYAVLGDPATDMVPDFAVGRIPVDTLAQANTVVNKIIAYEQTPPDNTAFYANAAIAAQFQCCRYDITSKGYDMRTFIEVSEFARNALTAAGKSVDRIYTETVSGYYSGDTTPRRYYDGGSLPAAIGPGYAWDGTTSDVVDAYNAGRFLFIHRDHGAPSGWSHPGFYTSNADDLTNGSLLPVVYSVNCSSGLWDNETAPGAIGTTSGGVYLAEALLRDAEGGAIGVLGDTRNSPSWANSALLRGFIDATWPTAIGSFGDATVKRRLGDILNHGKLYLWTQIGMFEINNTKARDELRMWHVIGDPSLEMWTRYPYLTILPEAMSSILMDTAIQVTYAQEGAEITAFEIQPNLGAVPIGRGTVKGGQALLTYVNEPYGKYPIEYYASLENSISRKLESK